MSAGEALCPSCKIKLEKPTFESRDPYLGERDAGRFVATAEEKKRLYNQWVRFISNGFQRKDFTKGLYHYLTQHHGDYAHYSESSYYDDYFSAPDRAVGFMEWFIKETHIHRSMAGVNRPTYAWQDLADAMNAAMLSVAPAIVQALKKEQENRDVATAQALLAQHGLTAEVKRRD